MGKQGGILTSRGATLIDNELNALRKQRLRSGVGQSDSPFMRDDYRLAVVSQDIGAGALVDDTINLGAGHVQMLYPTGDYQLTKAENEILVRSTYGLPLHVGRRVYLHREFVSGWWMAMPMYTGIWAGTVESAGPQSATVKIWLKDPTANTTLTVATTRIITARHDWMVGGVTLTEGWEVGVIECPEEGQYRLFFAECPSGA